MGGVGRESEVTQALRDSAPSFSATRYLMGERLSISSFHSMPNIIIFFAVVAVTLILYDHLLTLCDEVEHIWAARKWLNKLIFLVNRYIVETTLAGMAYCSYLLTISLLSLNDWGVVMLEPRSELSDKVSVNCFATQFLARTDSLVNPEPDVCCSNGRSTDYI